MRKILLSIVCLVLLVNIVSAEQCVIDQLTINPPMPRYEKAMYHEDARFSATIHVSNFPTGGHVLGASGCQEIYAQDDTILDQDGYGIIYGCIGRGPGFGDPEVLRVAVYDQNYNEVAYKSIRVDILEPGTSIPEFPTIAAPIAAILGLLLIVGRKKKEA